MPRKRHLVRPPRRLRVDCARNTISSMPLSRLDWSRWFTDGCAGGLYLHVYARDGDTIHRVYCRHSPCPRLSLDAGVLRWLVDPAPKSTRAAPDKLGRGATPAL